MPGSCSRKYPSFAVPATNTFRLPSVLTGPVFGLMGMIELSGELKHWRGSCDTWKRLTCVSSSANFTCPYSQDTFLGSSGVNTSSNSICVRLWVEMAALPRRPGAAEKRTIGVHGYRRQSPYRDKVDHVDRLLLQTDYQVDDHQKLAFRPFTSDRAQDLGTASCVVHHSPSVLDLVIV